MEKAAVIELYQRSVEKNKLYYNPFVGDGDSSAYRELCKSNVYGPTKVIQKEEDIGHVSKRMGSQLRSIVRDYKVNSCYFHSFSIFSVSFLKCFKSILQSQSLDYISNRKFSSFNVCLAHL